MKLLLRLFCAYCHHVADRIDRDYPPPHFPDTIGEAHAKFARDLRRFADDLLAPGANR